jgi:small basic protein
VCCWSNRCIIILGILQDSFVPKVSSRWARMFVLSFLSTHFNACIMNAQEMFWSLIYVIRVFMKMTCKLCLLWSVHEMANAEAVFLWSMVKETTFGVSMLSEQWSYQISHTTYAGKIYPSLLSKIQQNFRYHGSLMCNMWIYG